MGIPINLHLPLLLGGGHTQDIATFKIGFGGIAKSTSLRNRHMFVALACFQHENTFFISSFPISFAHKDTTANLFEEPI